MKYKGETKRILKFCLADHRGYINNRDLSTATGEHFNSPGHSLSDLNITVLKKLDKRTTEKKGKSILLENLAHSTVD